MGVTVDELITERMRDIGDIVEPLLLTDTAVEDDMQEDIPELLLDLLGLSPKEGIGELIDLLDGTSCEGSRSVCSLSQGHSTRSAPARLVDG